MQRAAGLISTYIKEDQRIQKVGLSVDTQGCIYNAKSSRAYFNLHQGGPANPKGGVICRHTGMYLQCKEQQGLFQLTSRRTSESKRWGNLSTHRDVFTMQRAAGLISTYIKEDQRIQKV